MNVYTHERAAMIAEGALIDLMQDDTMRRVVTGLGFPPTACTIEALNIIQDSFGLYATLCSARQGRSDIEWRSIVPITLFKLHGSEDHLIYIGGNTAGTIAGPFEVKTRLRLTGTDHVRQIVARINTLAQAAAASNLVGGRSGVRGYYLEFGSDIEDVDAISLSMPPVTLHNEFEAGFELSPTTVTDLASGVIRLMDYLPEEVVEDLLHL